MRLDGDLLFGPAKVQIAVEPRKCGRLQRPRNRSDEVRVGTGQCSCSPATRSPSERTLGGIASGSEGRSVGSYGPKRASAPPSACQSRLVPVYVALSRRSPRHRAGGGNASGGARARVHISPPPLTMSRRVTDSQRGVATTINVPLRGGGFLYLSVLSRFPSIVKMGSRCEATMAASGPSTSSRYVGESA